MGGMGVYLLVLYIFDDIVKSVVEMIVKLVVKVMVKEGCFFIGVLYVGLILMENGLKVIEFNVCFGDLEI